MSSNCFWMAISIAAVAASGARNASFCASYRWRDVCNWRLWAVSGRIGPLPAGSAGGEARTFFMALRKQAAAVFAVRRGTLAGIVTTWVYRASSSWCLSDVRCSRMKVLHPDGRRVWAALVRQDSQGC
jgi:hypothetical protein